MSRDLYGEVTDRIVIALEEGTVPWRRPWLASADSHRNPVSGTIYRGINPFLLELAAMECGYSDPQWLTFRQARTLGGNVRKGEKGSLVVFWKMLRGIDKQTGEERTIPMLRNYTVFNVAQCDGLELATEERGAFEPIEECAAVVGGMPNRPRITHGGNRAFYAPAWDAVQLPQPEQFTSPEAYYATAFHELTHSTGHSSRLNRAEVTEPHDFGSEVYGREELTAEMGAAMLCAVVGISPETLPQSASYVGSWLRTIKGDPKMVIQAAGRAQRAADYIRGIKHDA